MARGLFQTMDERLRNGTLDGAFVFDSHEGTLIILGVVQHVQAALRAELEVGGLTESQGRKNRMDALEFALGIQFRGLDPAAGVLADEPATLVARGQGELCGIRLAVAIDRAGNGGFAAIPEFGKFFLQSGVPDKRRLGRWQVADAGVSRMAIYRRLGVDHGSGFLGGRIVVGEGFLIGDDQRVAIKPGAFGEVEFVVTERDAFLFVQRPLDKQKSIPLGYDEFNLAKRAGFYGYPLVIANQEPFTHYDPATKKTGPVIDPKAPINRHSGNTGIRNLPPSQPPLIWYAGLQKEFPELGNGGESAIAGPIYRHRQTYPAKLALPARYESCWFIGEYARGWVKAAKLDAQGKLQSIHPVLPPLRLGKPTNLKLGPQGRLHVLYYTKDDQGALVRIENKGAVKSAIAQALVHGLEQPPRHVKKSPLAKRGLQLMTKSDCLNCINGRARWWPPRSSRSPNATATTRRLQKNWRTKCSKAALASGAKFPWHRIPSTPPRKPAPWSIPSCSLTN